VAPALCLRLAPAGLVLAPAAEEPAEAAHGDARRRRVDCGRHAPGGAVPFVGVGVARGPAALHRLAGAVAARRLDLPGEVLVVPHQPRRARPPERLGRPLQPRHAPRRPDRPAARRNATQPN
jgi:hypothetical protein